MSGTEDDDRGPIARATDRTERTIRQERARGRRVPVTTLPGGEFQQHETNDDTGRVTTFTKGIPPREGRSRTAGVLPDPDFDSFVEALLEEAYEDVLGLTTGEGVEPPEGERPLVNPAAASSFVTTGVDPNDVSIGRPTSPLDRPQGVDGNAAARTDAAPAFESLRSAAEMVELYWQAITRDVPFAEYDGNGAVERAIDELSTLDGYQDALPDGFQGESMPETAGNAFRGILPGAQQGPYVSQFLYLPVPRGANLQRQVFRPFDDFVDGGPDRDALADVDPDADPGSVDLSDTFRPDYLTSFEQWRDVQNGVTFDVTTGSRFTDSALQSSITQDTGGDAVTERTEPPEPFEGLLDDDRRHITTGRDLATYVRANPSQQPYLAAALILQNNGAPLDPGIPGEAAVTRSVPGAFVDYGRTEYQTAVVDVVHAALHAAWYRKWLVHRRLRPEEYGGRVDAALNSEPGGLGLADRVPEAVTGSDAVQLVSGATGSALLPQAYPNGSPTHPSYPAGHATTAGACTTVLKAFFDTSVEFGTAEGFQPELPADLVDEADESEGPLSGTVRPAPGAEETLEVVEDYHPTLEAELNKLATNMAIGRNWGGIHYRTDATAGYRLGERVALAYLEDRLAAREGDVTLTVPTFFGTDDLETSLELEAVALKGPGG